MYTCFQCIENLNLCIKGAIRQKVTQRTFAGTFMSPNYLSYGSFTYMYLLVYVKLIGRDNWKYFSKWETFNNIFALHFYSGISFSFSHKLVDFFEKKNAKAKIRPYTTYVCTVTKKYRVSTETHLNPNLGRDLN